MSAFVHRPIAVRPVQLIVRCFAEQVDDQWQAFSIDFGLAAQADTSAEVKAKLDGMIQLYVEEALVGEDRAHAKALLSRKAPLQIVIKYYVYRVLEMLRREGHARNTFDEPVSLAPSGVAV